ncbi:MAG: hypothetical protein D8M58_04700 [Calditrichaeota bacterium]|nr:MAG: hypothetical protein DWQ03_02375 [Calditrichota bacterium]MBL1204671.1 hypothetical protein [Calditrichota bacterium]NOG44499.1 hypothetical protein [Calditrichota bacterium]
MYLFIILIAVFAVIIGGITFYNTIITKKWRNKVKNEKDWWYLWDSILIHLTKGYFYPNEQD